MSRKHDRKKRSSPVMWSFVLTLLLIAAVSIALGIFQTAEEPAAEPAPGPVGTPTQAPAVDQRPAPSASPVPPAASVPAADPAVSQAQEDASSVPNSQSVPSEDSGRPEPEPVPVQAFDAKDGEQMVRGVIVDATTSSVTIQTADGTRLSFMRETADVTGRLVEEAEAEIYYVGSINGADTSAAFVTKIIAFA